MTKQRPTPAVNSLTLEQAHKLIHKLLDRITELEDRLNQHSGNSSKPPSSDGPGSAPPARLRPASGKNVALSLAIKANGGNTIHMMPACPWSLTIRLRIVPAVVARC